MDKKGRKIVNEKISYCLGWILGPFLIVAGAFLVFGADWILGLVSVAVGLWAFTPLRRLATKNAVWTPAKTGIYWILALIVGAGIFLVFYFIIPAA